jgi:quercetin dioxygenase-like cupin family protein
MHRHPVKHETFYVLEGHIDIELEGLQWRMGVSSSVVIEPGTWHRFSNLTDTRAVFVEFSTAHDDDDVERRTESGKISE